ncbi:hypothetical protein P22_3026 [Propionispora sp. 2/2-37]|uniref:hypothetical protein n=1 Tax=Propionispora sp. 2/2-37 TaxID=1677858 RepID=UPI0006BB55C0|nr:hypothetical protein [Propionispora sp. 2/2-37]CUH96914.1 hypothetical protein P22_3026 [Propionispora sp. 2/2-37]
MECSFTLFEPHRERSSKTIEPIIELRPNGRIVFNKLATELLDNSPFCMIGYDLQANAVGLLPLKERNINSFPIRYATKGAYVGAKKFFKHFNILPQQAVESSPFHSGEFIGVKL